jgi:hypothetical protein
MYYILKGDMFKKIGIDINKIRVCDIQADGSGVICPPSTVDRKFYNIECDKDISFITLDDLKAIFPIKHFERRHIYEGPIKDCPEKVKIAIEVLLNNKIKRTNDCHFKCPFHPMQGNGNLYVCSDAHIHCFHCSGHWRDVHHFIDELEIYRRLIV